MNTFTLLQLSEHVAAKSADMAAKDPHGAIITLVSVSMVFIALIILYFAYTFIGNLSSGKWKLKKATPEKKAPAPVKSAGQMSDEVAAAIAMALDKEFGSETYAAIGMALHQYFNDTVHDLESYIITIKRK